MKYPYIYNWSKVDWKLQDIAIAERLGCSRERVRQVRRELGVGESPTKGKVRRSASNNSALLKMLETHDNREVAEKFGLTLTFVAHIRKIRGIVRVRSKRWFVWTPEKILLLGTASDHRIARAIGTDVMSVNYKRRELGIPSMRGKKAVPGIRYYPKK